MRPIAGLCLGGGLLLSSCVVAGAFTLGQKAVFSQNKTSYLSSTDGHWLLIGSPEGATDEDGSSTLQLKNQQSKRTIAIRQYARFVEVGWNSDSDAFFLNDALSSDMESAAIYGTNSSVALDLDAPILHQDTEAVAAGFDHAYFRVKEWDGPHSLQVEYCGHSTGRSPDHEGYFLYQVTLDSKNKYVQQVSRINAHLQAIDDNLEECMDR